LALPSSWVKELQHKDLHVSQTHDYSNENIGTLTPQPKSIAHTSSLAKWLSNCILLMNHIELTVQSSLAWLHPTIYFNGISTNHCMMSTMQMHMVLLEK